MNAWISEKRILARFFAEAAYRVMEIGRIDLAPEAPAADAPRCYAGGEKAPEGFPDNVSFVGGCIDDCGHEVASLSLGSLP